MKLKPLRARVRGTILARGDADYDALRQSIVWNRLQPPHCPEIIAVPADDADVVECVRFARAVGLRIAVRGSGHHWCGVALQPGALLLDLSRLRDVVVDAGARTAAAQPGIRNGDLCRVLSAHGLAFPYGHCPTVALSGYLLSGGFGWNAGAWGPACLSVRAAEIVTADGRLIAADATHNADVFWAVRGAGAGFFGVVTRYHLALQPMPRAIVGSTFVYPLDLLPSVAAWLSTLGGELSSRVEVTLFAASAPAGLGSPTGGMMCVVEAQAFADTPSEAAAMLAALERGPAPNACVAQRIHQPLTYDDLFASMEHRFPEGQRYLADTFLSNAPPAEVLGAVSGLMSRAPSPRSLLLCVLPPPPAADAPPPPETAFSIAAQVFVIGYAIWDSPDADDINRAWHRDVVERLEPFSTSHYIGETDLNRPARARRSFAPAHWERLRALRAARDPDHLFHSILDEPAEASSSPLSANAEGDAAAVGSALPEWNVIVTSREQQQRRLRRALFPLVRLEHCGFRNVFVGHVQSMDVFLAAVAERLVRRPELEGWLGKVVPIERTFAVDLARFEQQLREKAAALVDQLVGRSFHVRVERRGSKGVINTHACEKALGDSLYAALQARGAHPLVAFRDPQVVIAVELIGRVAGIGMVTRELRERFPFVKID